MNRDLGRLFAPLLALGVFAFVLFYTARALQDSGVWHFGAHHSVAPPADPLADLDGAIARAQAAPAGGPERDPFTYGAATTRPTVLTRTVKHLAPAPIPEQPVLTAIVFDADPRAVVRWKGHEYSVRAGGLFDDFAVVSISLEQVVLRRGDQNIVLRRKPQGD